MNEKNELHNRNLHISELLNEEKVDIENGKVDIQDEKVDIESVLSEKGSDFSVKKNSRAKMAPKFAGRDTASVTIE